MMKSNPRPVQTLCSSDIHRISCGSTHSLALIGDSSQVSTLSPNYKANNDVLVNTWQCDMRGVSLNRGKDKEDGEEEELVVETGEGVIKNPK